MAPSPAPSAVFYLAAPIKAIKCTFLVTRNWKYQANSLILQSPGEPLLYCTDMVFYDSVLQQRSFFTPPHPPGCGKWVPITCVPWARKEPGSGEGAEKGRLFLWFLKGLDLAGQRSQQKKARRIYTLQCCSKFHPAHGIVQAGIPSPASRSGDPGLLFLFSRGMRGRPAPRPCSGRCPLPPAPRREPGCSQLGGHCLGVQAGSTDLPFDF